jgi:hypothetical protein
MPAIAQAGVGMTWLLRRPCLDTRHKEGMAELDTLPRSSVGMTWLLEG